MDIKKYKYIDSLRGLAICGVMLTHSAVGSGPTNQILSWFMNYGQMGVQLFYVASAITLCMSWNARVGHEKYPVLNFWLRRLFRIAPMFLVAIGLYVFLQGYGPRYWAPNGINGYFIALTAVFLHGFHPETINSVVPGGWSIAVEMTFYVIFPILVCRVGGVVPMCLMIFASLILVKHNGTIVHYIFDYPVDQKYIVDNFSNLNFVAQLPVFLFGMLAYIFMASGFNKKSFMVVGGCLLIAMFLEFDSPVFFGSMPRYIVAGVVFSIFAVFLSFSNIFHFVNGATVILGKLSYSMYLLHFAVLDLFVRLGISQALSVSNLGIVANFLLLIVVTALFASITLILVERPGIKCGAVVINRISNFQARNMI